MCQHLFCSKPQSVSCGSLTLMSLLSFCLSMSHFCLSFSYGRSEKKKKTLPSCHIFEQMKPALTGREHANPPLIPHRMEFNSGAQLPVYTCLDPLVVWWKA